MWDGQALPTTVRKPRSSTPRASDDGPEQAIVDESVLITGGFARSAGFAVSLMGAGTRTTGVVRCDQPRPIDLAARKARVLENVPVHIMDEVLARLATIFIPRSQA